MKNPALFKIIHLHDSHLEKTVYQIKTTIINSFSQIDEADLEDGEIDESDEEVAVVVPPPKPKVEEPKKAPESSNSSSKREKRKREHQSSDHKHGSSKTKNLVEGNLF